MNKTSNLSQAIHTGIHVFGLVRTTLTTVSPIAYLLFDAVFCNVGFQSGLAAAVRVRIMLLALDSARRT